MDLLAHALWVGIGGVVLQRRRPVSRATIAGAVGLTIIPDLAHALPVAAWFVTGGGSLEVFLAYLFASPGTEPVLPAWISLWSHHLHCTFHSFVVAGVVTAGIWRARGGFWLPLAGWWMHIALDMFTHSADFYPVPVLYPFTQRGFDGVAWNNPWFMALNYGVLAVAMVGLALTRPKRNLP